MDNVSLFAAFAAGLLSFVSPCVLPLIPGYLSFVSGATLEEMRGTGVTSRSAAVVSGARRASGRSSRRSWRSPARKKRSGKA